MATKRFVISTLVALNAVLLTVLAFSTYSVPKAGAQVPGRGGSSFVTVTAKVAGQSYDVLYVLDADEWKLHAFFPPNVQTKQLVYGNFRVLKADFGRR
jgi:hypothetical protein